MNKKRVAKGPNEGYILPKSSERGQSVVDWNQVLKDSLGIADSKPIKIVKKTRRKDGSDRK